MPAKTKLDTRLARSQAKIVDAFLKLSLEPRTEAITVRQLARCARIAPATFYRQFQDLDALKAHILHSALDQLLSMIQLPSTRSGGSLVLYTWIFENKDICRFFLSLPRTQPLRQEVLSRVALFIRENNERHEPGDASDNVAMSQILESGIEMVRWFIDNIDQFTPEQMVDMHDDIIARSARYNGLALRQNPQPTDPPPCMSRLS